jgi:lipopolysaccharide transport protein LptA
MVWVFLGLALATPTELTATQASVTVGVPEITINATHARWDLKESRGELSGGVTATQGDLHLRCDAARIELGEAQGIVRAVATGSVTVVQGDKSASGERAVLADGQLTLTGKPELRTPQHSMVGTKIVFAVGEQTIECEGCTVSMRKSD